MPSIFDIAAGLARSGDAETASAGHVGEPMHEADEFEAERAAALRDSGEDDRAGVAGDAQVHAEANLSSRRKNPQLTVNMPRLTGSRLGQNIPEDPWSPETPSASVMHHYRDPENLPGVTGTSEEVGHAWAHIGNSKVRLEYLSEHLQVRKALASTDRGQKYLAVYEQGKGLPQYAFPYRAYDGKKVSELPASFGPKLTGSMSVRDRSFWGGLAYYNKHGTDTPVTGYVTKYAIDNGLLSMRGGKQPPIAGGVHEIPHSVRSSQFSRNNPPSDWGGLNNVEEAAVIRKLENPTAIVQHWGLRDSHQVAGSYETTGFTETMPVSAAVQNVIYKNRGSLRNLTNILDRRGADPTRPTGEDREISRNRSALAFLINEEIERVAKGGKPRQEPFNQVDIDEVKKDITTPFD